jgi:hypothetical protein
MPEDRRKWDTLQQVIISIFIGAAISFVTTLMQGILEALQGFDPAAPGAVAGSLRYIVKWKWHNLS